MDLLVAEGWAEPLSAAPARGGPPCTALATIGAFGPFDLLSDWAHELYVGGRSELALAAADEALALVELTDDVLTWRYLHYSAACALMELRRWDDAAERARTILRRLDPAAVSWRAKALAVLADAGLRLSRSDWALDAMAEAYSLVRGRVATTYNELSAMSSVANVLAHAQLFEPAEQLFHQALASPAGNADTALSRFARLLTLQELAVMNTTWALALVLQGDAAAGRARYVLAAEVALATMAVSGDDPQLLARAEVLEAFAAGQLGSEALAAARLRAAAANFDLRAELPETLIARIGIADALVDTGGLDDARAHAHAVVAGAVQGDRLLWQLAGLSVLASIEVAEHGDHPAVEHLREARRCATKRLLAERQSQFFALRDRVRVRDLAATASRLDQEAMVDPLTGLGNRRMLDAGLAAGEPGAVLFVDVDQFKAVNDGHSYAAGDVVLQRVADILRAHCRLHDVVVRFGGDEFIVLLPGIAGPGAAEVGERVRSAVAREPWADVSPGLRVSVSVGAAGAGDDVDATLTLADQALHEAKRGGRDRVVLR